MPDKQRQEVRSQHIFTEKFTEGEWHVFKVLRMIEIPGDALYFLLETRMGNRLLMPAEYYHDYAISEGATIRCRIDKINCSGKIFLEPEHPFLKEGSFYEFRVTNRKTFSDRKGRIQQHFTLSGPDDMRNIAILEYEPIEKFPTHIKAKLIRIRKGILVLNEIEVVNNCS